MASNSRASRSRFSSPLHLSNSPSSHNRGVTTDGQRSFMHRWLEPPVQNKASFQEAGLIRGGVVENMAPLGTLPKAAMLKKPAQQEEKTSGVKRIVCKKPATTPTIETPPASAAISPALDPIDAAPSSPTRPSLRIPVLDDEDDEDYVPKGTGKTRRASNIQNASSTSSTRHPSHRRRRRSSARPTSPTTPTTQSTSLTFQPPSASRSRKPENPDLVDKVVEEAVDEALRHYRYPTAWALRLLYDENQSDPRFVSMLEDVFQQRADIETLQEFNRLVSQKKKEGKKDNKGCYYFVPPSTNSRFSPRKPKPAPYGDLLTMDASPSKETSTDADGHISKKVKLDNGSEADLGRGARGVNGLGSLRDLPDLRSPLSRKKARAGSVSSGSSLSSAPEDIPDDFEEYMDKVDEDLGLGAPKVAQSRTRAAEPNNAPTPGAAQPISTHHKKPASKKNVFPQPGLAPNTTHHTSSQDSSMPAAIITNGISQSSKIQATIKFNSKFGVLDESDSLFKKKLFKKAETKRVTDRASSESFTRRGHLSPALSPETEGEEAAPASTEPTRSSRTPALSSRATRAAKRNHDDVHDAVSPTAPSFKADPDPTSTRNSRAATPSNLRSNKKARSGVRIKTSPMKKKGTAAGIPRGSGEQRPSPVGNGPSHNQDDNDDSCYSCGGNGELVCCDGCNYSFHFMCIDPPMDEGHLPDEWYCNECTQRFYPAGSSQYGGPFGALLHNLERKNPRAFRLPEDIREYFEDVKTGPDGEYEEVVPAKPKAKKGGLEEPFDYFKLKNADGEPVLCHHCHQSASENRLIIPCSVCGLNWHLECLDPPLTIPPPLRNWRCPCHTNDVMSAVPGAMGPAHRPRKIKHAPVIKQAYARGLINNGWIEVEEEDETPDKVDGFVETWRERKGYGRVYRLPEKGIKLDFISRVRENRLERGLAGHGGQFYPAPTVPPRAHTLEEQQAALNLAALAGGQSEGVDQLVHALISQATPAAISIMSQGDMAKIASGALNQADLNALQAILLQAESLQKGVAKILESHNAAQPQSNKTSAVSGFTPATPSPSNDPSSQEPSHPSSSATHVHDWSPTKNEQIDDDSAMQVD